MSALAGDAQHNQTEAVLPEDGATTAAATNEAHTAARVPSSVAVAVRARPLGPEEGAAALRVSPTSVTISPGKSEHVFHFDYAYDGACQQETIYQDLGAPILRKALQGFNATIFAYGQTGSGKSHTMMGTDASPGVIPRMGEELFFCVDKSLEESPDKKFLLTCSYLEIYNEALQDLLLPTGDKKGSKEALEIKEHPTLGVFVRGLLELPVRSRKDVMRMMAEGNTRRVTGETKMNARSSRSHSIFSIRIQQQELLCGSDQKRETWSQINLVDLAGSERAGKTGAEGARMREGICINQSLSALGAVITALAESAKKGKMQHIPYRNSKLTRVLQESLGGNALTVMIANISSALSNLDESFNTLQYADRAKSIQVRATKNEQMSEVGKLREEVEALRHKLAEKVGVVRTEEEEKQLQQYRSQIEEYEWRLQQSFEEKEKACAVLTEQVKQHQQQVLIQHQQRRAQSAAQGDWLNILSSSNLAWDSTFLSQLKDVEREQRDAEQRLKQCESFIAALIQTVEDATAQLQQCAADAQASGTMDLSTTVDLSSAEGNKFLSNLRHSEQAQLQQCRHLLLRWQSLLGQLEQDDQVRKECTKIYQSAHSILGTFDSKQDQLAKADVDEAMEDAKCAMAYVQAQLSRLQMRGNTNIHELSIRVMQVLRQCLRDEETKLEAGDALESERAAKQRSQCRQDAHIAAAQLNFFANQLQGYKDTDCLTLVKELPLPTSLEVLERCVGHRVLQNQRHAPSAVQVTSDDKTLFPLEEQESLKKEIEALRAQNVQMLTVIGCQASTIEQVTAGSGDVSAREQKQLKVMATQAEELSALRMEIQCLRRERSEDLARTPKQDLLVQAELGELRFQQSTQLKLSEQFLGEQSNQMHALRERADAAERCSSDAKSENNDLREQIASLQVQIEQQAEELADARVIEQQFASLAAEMGCIDKDGRLMKQQLEEMTLELLKAKADEAEHRSWLQDVKKMMANGREDGLAMALAENMAHTQRLQKVIRQKDEEIKKLSSGKPKTVLTSSPPHDVGPSQARSNAGTPESTNSNWTTTAFTFAAAPRARSTSRASSVPRSSSANSAARAKAANSNAAMGGGGRALPPRGITPVPKKR